MKKSVTEIVRIASFLAIFGVCNVKAQYSNYYKVYSQSNSNVNANINSNVNYNVSGTVYSHSTQTINTIDYGALQLANAQREANRLENIKYADEQQRLISLEVASNPIKAFDYGYQNTFNVKGKEAKQYGFKSFIMSYKIPHNSVFIQAGAGRFENVSSNGITTEIIFSAPFYNKEKIEVDVEKIAKMENTIVGQLNESGPNGEEIFVHKKDISRANVFGVKGFKSTLIWEDDYQYTITDNFQSYDPSKKNGVMYFIKVRTYGSKNEVTFEELEGRRYYLRQLIEKIISTAGVYDMKY